MPKNFCIMQIWAEPEKAALPICNYSQILYQFLTFTQNLKRSPGQSSQAFYDQFSSLEPSFSATAELITSIAQQLRDVSTSMQNIDREIAGKIGVM